MTKVEELTQNVKELRSKYGHLEEYEAYAIACPHYTVGEFMELKRRLDLNGQELVETIIFIHQRDGMNSDVVTRTDRDPSELQTGEVEDNS